MNYKAYEKALAQRDVIAYRALGTLSALHRAGDLPEWATPIVALILDESVKIDEAVDKAATEKVAA